MLSCGVRVPGVGTQPTDAPNAQNGCVWLYVCRCVVCLREFQPEALIHPEAQDW